MNFVQNLLWNSVEGFVEAGTRTAGGYAGDVLIKAGDVIENSGRGIGNAIERRASDYGSKLAGENYKAPTKGKALPSTASRTIAKRSNSLPTNTKALVPTSNTPIGARKNTGGKKKAAGSAMKQITNGPGVSNVVGAQKRITGGVTGATTAAKNTLPKAFPNNVPYGTSATPASTRAPKKKPLSTATQANNLPKPYPQTPASLSKPTTAKKTAVKAGLPKPFSIEHRTPGGLNSEKKTTYPGTNTYVGQGSKTPVTSTKKYKPLPRMSGTADTGKMQHIPGFTPMDSKMDSKPMHGMSGSADKGMQHIPGF